MKKNTTYKIEEIKNRQGQKRKKKKTVQKYINEMSRFPNRDHRRGKKGETKRERKGGKEKNRQKIKESNKDRRQRKIQQKMDGG